MASALEQDGEQVIVAAFLVASRTGRSGCYRREIVRDGHLHPAAAGSDSVIEEAHAAIMRPEEHPIVLLSWSRRIKNRLDEL